MQKVVIIEDFYEAQDFGIMSNFALTCSLKGLYVPHNIYYPSRLQAYPTWECNFFIEKEMPYQIFKNTLKRKTHLNPIKIDSSFRKVLTSELEQSPYKGREESLIHQDSSEYDWAGVVYFDSFCIRDGTRIYSYREQVEPDIIVGSKPNRCVLFKADLFHSAAIDWRRDSRLIQLFFLKEGIDAKNNGTN